MSGKPDFSVIVPTFQRSASVLRCIASIDAIEDPSLREIIVVVDGSTDDTVVCLEEFQSRHTLVIIEQENSGAASARNAGAAAAQGEVLLFLDDDMVAGKDLVTQHLLEYAAGADAIVGDVLPDPASPESFLKCGFGEWTEGRRSEQAKAFGPMDVLSGHLSVRREVFAALGGFDSSMTAEGRFSCEDMDLGFRLFEQYDVRRLSACVTSHVYLVSPSELIARTPAIARGDVHFAFCRPDWGRTLFRARKSAMTKRARWFYRPVGRLPGAAGLAAVIARLVSTPRMARHPAIYPHARKVFDSCRELVYWAAAQKAARGSNPWA